MTSLSIVLICFNYLLLSSYFIEVSSSTFNGDKMDIFPFNREGVKSPACVQGKRVTKKRMLKGVEKWEDCREACNNMDGCDYFKHHGKKNLCSLTSIKYKRMDHIVSGEKNCSLFSCNDCDTKCQGTCVACNGSTCQCIGTCNIVP